MRRKWLKNLVGIDSIDLKAIWDILLVTDISELMLVDDMVVVSLSAGAYRIVLQHLSPSA